MKIHIVYKPAYSSFENPFVGTLKDALSSVGNDVTWGIDDFFDEKKTFDAVLFQWPEGIADFKPVNRDLVGRTRDRVTSLKKRGVKIGYTRHNILPHYSADVAKKELYNIVEGAADVVFHMGEYSLRQFVESGVNINAVNVITPHHITPTYDRSLDKITARGKLGISDFEKVVLSFGSFRDDEERDLVINAFSALKIPNKRLLAPGFFTRRILRRNPFGVVVNIVKRLPYARYGFFKGCKRVSNDELPLYFTAADVIFIQRKRILNSGNLPMGYYFGKVVVGPNVGNVGEILKETGNPTFDPNDNNSVVAALGDGIRLSETSFGGVNQSYADRYWNPNVIAHKILTTLL